MKRFLSNEKISVIVILFILVITSFNCGGTARLSNMWRDTAYTGGPITNVLVIAVRKNEGSRRIWEDGFVSALKEHGISATPSYALFQQQLPDTNRLIETAKKEGFDGAIIIGKAASKTHYEYYPGYVTTEPLYMHRPWYWDYYGYYQTEYTPPEVVATKVVRNQVDVWSLKGNDQLVWTGTGEEIDPSSSQDANKEIVKAIIPELAKQGIIPQK